MFISGICSKLPPMVKHTLQSFLWVLKVLKGEKVNGKGNH